MSEPKKIIRAARMSKIQKEFLVTFLEKHKYLLETKIDPFQLEKFNTTWKDVAAQLNGIQGAKKTVSQWKEVSTRNLYFLYIIKTLNSFL